MIVGLIFGIYLIDVKNTSQLVFVDGPSISIVTEKSNFKKGELIKITIVNSGTVPLTSNTTGFGFKITGLSGILIYSPDVGMEESSLDPGGKIGFHWYQIKDDGNAALEGLYKISARGVSQGNNVEKSIIITISK